MRSQVGLRKHHCKACGGDAIPVELFQILKDDAIKVLHSVCQQIWKTQQWPQDWKRSVFFPIAKESIAKEASRILQARLQQYVNQELPDVQVGLKKAEEPEFRLPASVGS